MTPITIDAQLLMVLYMIALGLIGVCVFLAFAIAVLLQAMSRLENAFRLMARPLSRHASKDLWPHSRRSEG